MDAPSHMEVEFTTHPMWLQRGQHVPRSRRVRSQGRGAPQHGGRSHCAGGGLQRTGTGGIGHWSGHRGDLVVAWDADSDADVKHQWGGKNKDSCEELFLKNPGAVDGRGSDLLHLRRGLGPTQTLSLVSRAES